MVLEANKTHSCTVFVHWMTQFVIFAAAAEEEARLTHIEIETFQAAIAEAHNWILFTNVAFRLMFCTFSSRQTMQHR